MIKKKIKHFAIIWSLLFSFSVCAQEIEVKLYKQLEDLLAGEPTRIVKLIPKEVANSHIRVKKFTSDIDKQDRREVRTSFALEYNGIKYFNLENSEDHHQSFTYVKFDIIGKYCAVIIDKNTPNIVKNGGGTYMGLSGFIGSESRKWNKYWYDTYGLKRKILFINPEYENKEGRIIANLLTGKEVQLYFDNTKSEEEIRRMYFEEVEELIKIVNSKNLQE